MLRAHVVRIEAYDACKFDTMGGERGESQNCQSTWGVRPLVIRNSRVTGRVLGLEARYWLLGIGY